MDYLTNPTSRKDLRRLAPYLRKLFDVASTGAFPVLMVLEKLSDVFKNCNYEIVEDSKLPAKTMVDLLLKLRNQYMLVLMKKA